MCFLRKHENLITLFILFFAFLYNTFFFMGYYNSIIYSADTYNVNPLFNSDSIQLAVMFQDLVLGDGKWSDWYFSAAPYFFPDMLIWFVLNSIIPSFYYTFIAYFLIQQLLLLICIYCLVKEFATQKTLIISSIIFIFVLHFSVAHIYAFLPVFHFSEFVFGIFWLVLAIKILKTNSISYMLLFLILGTLLKLSDNIFVVHFMAPFVCAVIFLRIISYISIKEFFTFLALIVISYIFGSILYNVIIPINTQYNIEFSLKAFLDNIDEFINIFTKTKKIKSFSIIFIISIFAFILILLFNDKIKNKLNSLNLLLMLFSIFACGGIIVFTAHDFLPVGERYYLSIVCIPVIISLIFILPYFKKSILFILLLVAILAPNYKIFKDFNLNLTYSSKLSKCVDDLVAKYNVKNGLSEYWQAKIIQVISGVKMAQFVYDFEPHLAVTSKNFFKDKYDFVIINGKPIHPQYKLDKTKIIKINGKPDELITCGDSEILYYKDGLYLSYLNKYNKEVFDANNKLYTNIGKINNAEIVVNDNSAQNFAAFGPAIKIEKGKYKIDIVYSSSLDEDEEGDFWDIYLSYQSKAEVVKSGFLSGSKSAYKTFSVDFESKEDAKFEARVFYKGRGELKIKEIILYKQ